ncbi:MAG: hypothetical protein WA642_24820 [Steroidobacteraceae bacterium]
MTVERDDFNHAMRSVANSVAVVTTDGAAGCHGATVTVFCLLVRELTDTYVRVAGGKPASVTVI